MPKPNKRPRPKSKMNKNANKKSQFKVEANIIRMKKKGKGLQGKRNKPVTVDVNPPLDPVEANKRALRQQRFKTNVNEDETKRIARRARFGLSDEITPIEVSAEERENRKKRALRFETTNPDIENEKILQRQQRFQLSDDITSQSWEARLAARSLRFGNV